MNTVQVSQETAHTLRQGHPWVYPRGVLRRPPALAPGDIVRLEDPKGCFLGYACHSTASAIPFRLLSTDETTPPDEAWLARRLRSAVALRLQLNIPSDAIRLAFGEADGLPGLVIDRYADILVCQFHTPWSERHKDLVVSTLRDLLRPSGILEKDEPDIRRSEGLPPIPPTLLHGEVPETVRIRENTLVFELSPWRGQKTGWYLDQRDNRRLCAAFGRDRHILDAFSSSGAFAVHCLKAGARSVLRLDTSAEALAAGEHNLRLNGLDPATSPSLRGNAFEELRRLRDRAASFDMVILDPPGLAPSKATLPKALRALKDLHLLGLKLLRPGGLLASFSCSAAVGRDDLLRTLRWAEQDTGRTCRILLDLGQPADHPRLPGFPPSAYLKGFLAAVD